MPGETVAEALLKKVAEALDQRRIPYMVIGGQALLVHGRPRLTQDVDITLGVETDRVGEVLELCRALVLSPRREDPEQFVQKHWVLPTRDEASQLGVDFVFSSTPYEREALGRASEVPMAGYPVRFVSAEDLVIHKLFAGRAVDLEDVKAVLLRQGDRLDERYVRRWLKSFEEVEESGANLLATWDRLCKEASE